MDIEVARAFFMWCSIINGGVFLVWGAMCLLAQDWVYRTQSVWFKIPRETFTVLVYGFLGLIKIVVLVFNIVPFVALSIMG